MTRTEALEYLRGKGLYAFERGDDLIMVAKESACHRGITYYPSAVCIARLNGGWIAERPMVGRVSGSSEVLELAQACARAEHLLALLDPAVRNEEGNA